MDSTYNANPNEPLTQTERIGISLIGSVMAAGVLVLVWGMTCRTLYLVRTTKKRR